MRSIVPVAVLALLLLSVGAAAGQGEGVQAELTTERVLTNFLDEFTVRVENHGPGPITVTQVSVTITWAGWAPTLYQVFSGTAVIEAGEAREFRGPPTRMPNTPSGDYSCFVSVTADRGGGPVESRFPGTIEAGEFNVSILGVPEEFLVPIGFAAMMIGITLVSFRWERRKGWPPFRAVPRHQFRRT